MSWQFLAFLAPLAATFLTYMAGYFNGNKTTITSALAGVAGAAATVDFTWLPVGIAGPLAAGLGLSAVLANTVFTERV